MKAFSRFRVCVVMSMFVYLVGCDFFRWHEAHIRIAANGDGFAQLEGKIRRVLMLEGFDEWKDYKTLPEQEQSVRIFNLKLGTGEAAQVRFSKIESGDLVLLVFRQHQVRRFSAKDNPVAFTTGADKALRSLVLRLQQMIGESRILIIDR
jgi:hypothetical protein